MYGPGQTLRTRTYICAARARHTILVRMVANPPEGYRVVSRFPRCGGGSPWGTSRPSEKILHNTQKPTEAPTMPTLDLPPILFGPAIIHNTHNPGLGSEIARYWRRGGIGTRRSPWRGKVGIPAGCGDFFSQSGEKVVCTFPFPFPTQPFSHFSLYFFSFSLPPDDDVVEIVVAENQY